ncbi:hypothetical protein M0657_012270 [Pyricularia oryzae]|uniref:Uncharacterized protein n=1 Tax=Pyricularia oryzae (strain P131) TaxID=1143193 RepID=L7J8V4_PYRO1|nr:hypothetical protein M9X92_012178 [Pyricularia oryzae]KAI7908486.1 hypothetical protein M0657_012270 [Pyricularia oryzae]
MQFSTLTLLAASAFIPAIYAASAAPQDTCHCTGDDKAASGVKSTTEQCCANAIFGGGVKAAGKFTGDVCDYTGVAAFKNFDIVTAIEGFDSCCRTTKPGGVQSAQGGQCQKSTKS